MIITLMLDCHHDSVATARGRFGIHNRTGNELRTSRCSPAVDYRATFERLYQPNAVHGMCSIVWLQ